MSEKGMRELQVSHLEIAAKTWARAKADEIGGVVVDNVLTQSEAAKSQIYGSKIEQAENHTKRFLSAWLANCLIEFVRGYSRDIEERALQIERLINDAVDTRPFISLCGQPERDAKIVAEAQEELLKAIDDLMPYLPDRNDALNYAATNDGQASQFQVAALKLREVYNRVR